MKKNSIDNRIDYSLILPVFLLLIIGVIAIYVSVHHDYPNKLGTVMAQQVAWLVLGVVISFVVMLFPTKFLWRITPILYLFGLFLMVLPLIFYSPSLYASTGAKNWVTINNMTLFQPSEFMKLSYILMLARALVVFQQKKEDEGLSADFRLLGLMSLITAPVLFLLFLQKDLGTALVFMAIFAGLVLVSGVSWKIILSVLGLAVTAVTVFLVIFLMPNGKEFLSDIGMDTYQINRISAWLNPFEYADTVTFQQAQGLIAIGSGGLLGKGFNQIELAIPVRESDMIFTVIAENFGFLGSSVVLGLYLLLIYRMVRVTFESNNRFYTYISTGFIMMILFHIFENIGAAVGILPLTGIPLPFISQGGSAMISNLIGVGLVLSMAYQNNLAEEKQMQSQLRRSWR